MYQHGKKFVIRFNKKFSTPFFLISESSASLLQFTFQMTNSAPRHSCINIERQENSISFQNLTPEGVRFQCKCRCRIVNNCRLFKLT